MLGGSVFCSGGFFLSLTGFGGASDCRERGAGSIFFLSVGSIAVKVVVENKGGAILHRATKERF
jgi:hypothetical protein